MKSISYFLALPILCVLAGAASADQSPDNRKYYIDGKRIPTPDRVPPIYPQKEFRRRIGGSATIAFDYDASGRVTAATVKSSSGNKNIDNAALVAVRQWKITPLPVDGHVVAGSSEAAIVFTP